MFWYLFSYSVDLEIVWWSLNLTLCLMWILSWQMPCSKWNLPVCLPAHQPTCFMPACLTTCHLTAYQPYCLMRNNCLKTCFVFVARLVMLNTMMIVTSPEELEEQNKASIDSGKDLFVSYMELFGVSGECHCYFLCSPFLISFIFLPEAKLNTKGWRQ